MARRSRMSILKRQRELKKAEKAARKRAKRHGLHEEGSTEPRPTVSLSEIVEHARAEEEREGAEQNENAERTEEPA